MIIQNFQFIIEKKNSNLIVFIDSAFPYSTSDFNLTGDNSYVDVRKWYNDLNNLLNFLAKKFIENFNYTSSQIKRY